MKANNEEVMMALIQLALQATPRQFLENITQLRDFLPKTEQKLKELLTPMKREE